MFGPALRDPKLGPAAHHPRKTARTWGRRRHARPARQRSTRPTCWRSSRPSGTSRRRRPGRSASASGRCWSGPSPSTCGTTIRASL